MTLGMYLLLMGLAAMFVGGYFFGNLFAAAVLFVLCVAVLLTETMKESDWK